MGEGPLPPASPGLGVGRLLGQGGAAAVWLVTDDDGHRFALKVPVHGPGADGRAVDRAERAPTASGQVPPRGRRATRVPDADADADVDPDLEHELRLLHRFQHEHLLTVYRMVPTDQGPGLLLELAAGGSLLNLVTSRGPLPVPEVVTAIAPVAQALGYLHDAGALHGDVTPGNILFTSEGKPLLADLGTGRLLGGTVTDAAGTPGFVDPTASGSFDPCADIFALAAVTWFALTGRVPGPTAQRPPLVLIVPDVPPEVMRLVEDGLRSARDDRPTADEFARILLGCTTPRPVDLVSAVHPSVLPELLTRRTEEPVIPRGRGVGALRGQGQGQRDRGRPVGDRRRSGRGPQAARRPTTDRSGGGRSGGGQSGGGRAAAPGELVPGRLLRVSLGAVGAVLLLGAGALILPWVQGLPDDEGARSAVDGPIANPPSDVPERTPDGEPTLDAGWSDTSESVRPEDGEDPPTLDESPGVPPVASDPVVALRDLVALRAATFTEADPLLLDAVDVEGSPAMSTDRDAVSTLENSGRSLQDFSIEIRDPRLLAPEDMTVLPAVASLEAVDAPPEGTSVALVRATAVLSSYTEAAPPTAAEVSALPLMAASHQELIFVLWHGGNGWRIHSAVTPPS